ncbi:lycopene cyclase domain-containing protein [Leucobacter insecticola]|uniref:Lycopene cyclase domain-containing protein n=1 Tax=Leucobacter insecticola TaxID=2714934 RepID=A0A6G8FJI5_9MICO|nr:lycopene cyclase domain-containing protein [Leucobacter insecticola]QIM16537.1 lycopene cyclase domain-containing protein [Leucobacter insecticola]
MSYLYLACLLGGIVCMLLLDLRFRLFFWKSPASAALVTLAGVTFLLLWDAAGIATGIFLRGDATIASGIVLAPEMPLEEPVFLLFLVLCAMILYTGATRLLGKWTRKTDDETPPEPEIT